jgi:hypothetical protein
MIATIIPEHMLPVKENQDIFLQEEFHNLLRKIAAGYTTDKYEYDIIILREK